MFIRKEIKVKALQWTGNNFSEMKDFIGSSLVYLAVQNAFIIAKLNLTITLKDYVIIKEDGSIYRESNENFKKEYKEE